MRREVTILAADGAPARSALDGPASAGGGPDDGVRVPGAPPSAALLFPCAAGVVVEARAGPMTVAGHPLSPGERRVLRPGERAELWGTTVAVDPDPGPDGGTRAAAGALLRLAAEGTAALPGPHLLVVAGPAAGERVALGAAQTLGRGAAADVRVRDPAASRVHARVRIDGEGATIEDLRSKNGVRVNGAAVRRRRLAAGDEIGIGGVVLVFEDPFAVVPPGGSASPTLAARGVHAFRWVAAALLAGCAVALAMAG